MDTIGFDLHKRESQLCIIAEEGTVTERRISTSRERLSEVLGDRPIARILLEALTESAWVAQHLESLGHQVIVADPNFAPMYATRSRRVKADRRDARTLADALRLGAYRPAHPVSAARRHWRAELAVREALVRTRARHVSVAKVLVRRDGLCVPNGEARYVAHRIAALELPPLLTHALASEDATVGLLRTAPGIGPITAPALVATADDIARFRNAHQFEAFLGLVPGELSSGEKRRIGRITKQGDVRTRYLLVEAAWRILRLQKEDTIALRMWALGIAARRGKRIAVVALARRVAGIVFAMWRDGRPFDGSKLRTPRPRAA